MQDRSMTLTQEDCEMIAQQLRSAGFEDFLQLPMIRYKLAAQRAERLAAQNLQFHAEVDPAAIENTIDHNLVHMFRGSAMARPDLLINVLKSIQLLWLRPTEVKVLCVGPRTEAELFALMAAGYKLENIRGLDLISYSPFVDLGDMHKMPYEDNSFDLVMMGWVMGYSNDQQKVANEILRVCRDGAIVAIGNEYEPATDQELASKGRILTDGCPRYSGTEDYFKLFEGHVGDIYFKHDVPERLRNMVVNVMAVFSVTK